MRATLAPAPTIVVGMIGARTAKRTIAVKVETTTTVASLGLRDGLCEERKVEVSLSEFSRSLSILIDP